MTRLTPFLALTAAGGALFLIAAQQPSALSGSKIGQWELSAESGATPPTRECIADMLELARVEHRGKTCSVKIISDGPGSAVVQYSCGAAGFGRTQIDVITPRSLRISTQGISDSLPFNYVLQARRIGDCGQQAFVTRH